MSSKFCPKCKRIISTNGIPNYCPYGCGSLNQQPLIPKDISLLEYLKLLREEKTKEIKEIKQLKLF